MTVAVHVAREASVEDLRVRRVRTLCGDRISWTTWSPWVQPSEPGQSPGYVRRLTGLVDGAEVARWLEQVTCTACKAALAQEALQATG